MDVHASPTSDGDPEPLVRVEGLSRRFGERVAVAELSFEVRRGELFGLVGPDGAGKTTTLRMLAGVLRPSAGDAWIGGGDASTGAGVTGARGERAAGAVAANRSKSARAAASVARDPEAVKRHLAYMSQRFGLYTDLTVRENLEVARQPPRDGAPTWSEDKLYALFPNLAAMPDRPGGRMSGGEQQMLTVARTLMGNPYLVLLDEPSEGVAPLIVEEMARMIVALKKEGVSVLLSEQNLHFARLVADRAVVLEKGEVKFVGAMDALMGDEALLRAHLSL